MTQSIREADVRFDGEHLDFSPEMNNKVIPALEEIISEVQSSSRGKFPLEAFGREILPLLMSENQEEQQLGRQRHFAIANNNPFNEVELYNERNEVVFILPPAMMRIPSLRGHLGEIRPIADAKPDFMIARSQDMMFGQEPTSLRSHTGELYRGLAEEYQDIANPKVLIVWDQIVTYFGYPSFFKPEEKKLLIEKGLTFEWEDKRIAPIQTSKTVSVDNAVAEEESYGEDDWEM